MRHRLLAAVAGLTVLSLGLALAQTENPPRKPWGDPDLEGLWNTATLTVLERPPELASKEFFTPEEVAAYEKERRGLPPPFFGVGNASSPVRSDDTFFPELGDIVKSLRTSLVIDPPDGRIPPLVPAAQRAVDARNAWVAAHPADGPEDRWLTERCLIFGASGPPMIPEPYNSNYLIVQTPELVTILTEFNHDLRVVPLDGRPHLSESIQQWVGDSRGRWEGDTLVVETTNLKFNKYSRFGAFYMNGLSDENLRVVERFTRTDAETITYQATVEDPTVFARPWTIELFMNATEGPIFEFACHEGNYGLANILSGQRAEERAAEGKQ